MNTIDLDNLILSLAASRWQKVAMLIVKVTRADSFSALESDDEFEVVVSRIKQLVADGELAAEGDLSQWRNSEVRLNS
jgi:hypothetical protein